jgi:hypothetical protein
VQDQNELIEVDDTVFAAAAALLAAETTAVPIRDGRLEPGTNYLSNLTGRLVAVRQLEAKGRIHCLLAVNVMRRLGLAAGRAGGREP